MTAPGAAPRAVVFAYHDVGVRCLRVLLAGGVDVALVVTHDDDPAENIWYGSVRTVCREHGIATTVHPDPADPALLAAVRAARPDFIFSFYYRHMLPAAVLALAPASGLTVISCKVAPVRSAPCSTAQLTGARPRNFGSSEPCMLYAGANASTAAGSMWR